MKPPMRSYAFDHRAALGDARADAAASGEPRFVCADGGQFVMTATKPAAPHTFWQAAPDGTVTAWEYESGVLSEIVPAATPTP